MKAYLSILLTVAATMILCVVAVGVIVDPYRVVHPLIGEFSFEPNSRVPKVAYLSHNCSRYDAYFVGDSRSMTLSADDLGDVQGRRFYNFSTLADDIESIVRRLNFLIDKGCPISTVIAGESIDVLMDEGEKNAYSLLLSENPVLSGENRLSFYSKYFLSAQALITYARALHNNSAARDIYYPDGHADYLFGMENGAAFALPRCGATQLGDADRKLLFGRLVGYRKIASMSARYHFKTIVWIAPLNTSESRLFDDPVVKDYLQQLRAIPNLPVIEADRNSPLLADFHNWHDCGHFRRTLFDQLVAPAASRLLEHSAKRVTPGITENASTPTAEGISATVCRPGATSCSS
jgi:hypothetical protein